MRTHPYDTNNRIFAQKKKFFATKGPVQKFDLNQGQTINFRLTKICYMGILYGITCSRNDNTVFGCSANAFFLPVCSHAYNINYNKFADTEYL